MLKKPGSQFNEGMQPLLFSTLQAQRAGLGWRRVGHDICYYENHLRDAHSIEKKTSLFTLSFTITSEYGPEDHVYIAYCYPFTYTDCARQLREILKDERKQEFTTRSVICRTLCGNPVDLLRITASNEDRKKKAIVITSRVHPGETVASWMMKGFLDYITSDSKIAILLRRTFEFYVVPMLNPDGVINGNHRCSLAGVDLNRQYLHPDPKLHPTIFAVKNLVKDLQREREVLMVLDMHGHSRKKNIFIFGNTSESSYSRGPVTERTFPFLLSRISPVFSFQDCSFRVQKAKESAARVVYWKELGIMHSYTIESSFCGCTSGPFKDILFTPEHLGRLGGADLCEALLDFCNPDVVAATVRELEMYMQENGERSQATGVESDGEEDSIGGRDGRMTKKKGDGLAKKKTKGSVAPKKKNVKSKKKKADK